MRASLRTGGLLLGLLAWDHCAEAGTLLWRRLPPGPHPGSRERAYQVFVPEGLRSEDAAPVVMVLHGCLQSEQSMIC